MTVVKEEKKQEEKKEVLWTKEEREKIKSEYGCDIVVENGLYKDVTTKNAPTDSYIVKYMHDDKIHFDLTRGSKTNLFDMYWDKFKGGLKSIDYGNGTIKPYLWGYKAPQQKKKRKG